jgi:hypothetical protein
MHQKINAISTVEIVSLHTLTSIHSFELSMKDKRHHYQDDKQHIGLVQLHSAYRAEQMGQEFQVLVLVLDTSFTSKNCITSHSSGRSTRR